MSVEAAICTALSALVPTYPDVAPFDTSLPYATYQQVGGQVITLLESAVAGKRNGRFQISIWSATRIEAADLMRQMEAALITDPALRALPLGAMVATYDAETKTYGARQFFSIWY